MTTTTAVHQTTDRRPVLPVAVATFLGTCAFTALGTFADGTPGADEHGYGEFAIIIGLSLVACVVVLGLVVPRVQDGGKAAGTGLGLAIAALLLTVAFWSGLTPPLAVGGVLLGAAARRTGRRPGLGTAAVVVSALALVAYVAFYVTDWMMTNNIAGM